MSQAAAERGRVGADGVDAAPRTILGEFWRSKLDDCGRAGSRAGGGLVATRSLTRFCIRWRPDPLSIATAIGIVVLLALLAAFLPGWRAAKTNPARVLQEN
jgi:ABC-type lipoprotein release transport system permease subunit